MNRTTANVQAHCHIKQQVIDMTLNRIVKTSEMMVRGTEFHPRQYQAA